MGQMRFLVTPPQRITDEVLQLTYMSGMDRTPWLVRVEADDGECGAGAGCLGFGLR